MGNRYPDDSEFGSGPRWSPELVWSTLLVLAIGAGVLLWAYFGPHSLSPAYRATETPAAFSGR